MTQYFHEATQNTQNKYAFVFESKTQNIIMEQEYEDDPVVLQQKLTTMRNLVRNAKHLVVYTGAGISTAASIPDFRGAEGLARNPKPLVVIGVQESDMDMKVPTYAHLVLADLTRRGHIKCVVTSNHDDLHGKAGTPRDKLVDLFGNCYVERCGRCKKLWQRHSIVPNIGRVCDDPACGGRLAKTGTRFGAPTPAEPLRIAIEQSNAADVALVMGSSLTVSPFCELPTMAKNGYIVCNLQNTPYDTHAKLSIHARCDVIARALAEEFNVQLTEFSLSQPLRLSCSENGRKVTLRNRNAAEYPTCVESARLLLRNETHKIEMTPNSNNVFEFEFENAPDLVSVELKWKPLYQLETAETFHFGNLAPNGYFDFDFVRVYPVH